MTDRVPEGLEATDLEAFSDVWLSEIRDMAERLAQAECDLAVVDTLQLPGLDRYSGAAALVLRQVPNEKIPAFRRIGRRPWDFVMVPNPPGDWRPAVGSGFAFFLDHVGWIAPRTGTRGDDRSTGIVVAADDANPSESPVRIYPLLEAVFERTRRRAARPFRVRQAIGARNVGQPLKETDEQFYPEGGLTDVFRRADIVISTAGYRQVLELAATDTPALLIALPDPFEDQKASVRLWGTRLGFGLHRERVEAASEWLTDQIERPRRRAPVELGHDGAERAARMLSRLLCPIS